MSQKRAGKIRLHFMGMLLLSLLAFIFLLIGLSLAQETKETETKKPWTGKLDDGRVITQADLDRILQAHALWLKSERMINQDELDQIFKARALWLKSGTIGRQFADREGADLSGANLSGQPERG